MQLTQYLENSATPVAEFARQIGVDQVTVYRWCKGKRFPREHIRLIAEVTKGSVTANDFFSIQPAKPQKGRAA